MCHFEHNASQLAMRGCRGEGVLLASQGEPTTCACYRGASRACNQLFTSYFSAVDVFGASACC